MATYIEATEEALECVEKRHGQDAASVKYLEDQLIALEYQAAIGLNTMRQQSND